MAAGQAEFRARVDVALRDVSDSRALRRRVLDVVLATVPYDAFVWPLTDPETAVGTSPLAEVPCLPELGTSIRLRYQAPERWGSTSNVVTWETTGFGEWRDFVASYSVRDVATVPFVDGFGCWGFLDLWRDREFAPDEVSLLQSVAPAITSSLRRCQASSITSSSSATTAESGAVMVLSPDLDVRGATEESDALLRRLLPTESDRAPVPASAYNVAAQLLANERGVDSRSPTARAFLSVGQLLEFRAARLGPDGDIAVTIGPVPPRQRLSYFALACGLSPREREVLECLADGDDTRTVASRLFMSEFTVQDHLKSIGTKTGLRSRRTLLARAIGG